MTGKNPSTRKNLRRNGKLSQEPSLQNLFVACLPRDITNGMLFELFAPFHPTTATVMLNMATGKSKGFGFVVFEKDEDGEAAMQHYADRSVTMDGITTGAFVMHISPSKFNGKSIVVESQYVFFRNIPSCIHKQELRAYFSNCGQVKHIQQREDENSPDRSLVLLMVEYSTVDEAKQAIEQYHQQVLFPEISSTPVMAKFADMTTVKAQNRKHNRQSKANTPQASALSPHSNASTPQQGNLSLEPYRMPRCFSSEDSSEMFSDFGSDQSGQSRRMSLASSDGRRLSASTTNQEVLHALRRPSETSLGSPCSQSSRPDSACWFRNDPYKEDGYVVVDTPAGFDFSELSRTQTPTLFQQRTE